MFPPCPRALNSLASQAGSDPAPGQIHPSSTASGRRQGSRPHTWFSVHPNVSKSIGDPKPEDSLVAHCGRCVSWLPRELTRFNHCSSSKYQHQPHLYCVHFMSAPKLLFDIHPFLLRVQTNQAIICEITAVWAARESNRDWTSLWRNSLRQVFFPSRRCIEMGQVSKCF